MILARQKMLKLWLICLSSRGQSCEPRAGEAGADEVVACEAIAGETGAVRPEMAMHSVGT